MPGLPAAFPSQWFPNVAAPGYPGGPGGPGGSAAPSPGAGYEVAVYAAPDYKTLMATLPRYESLSFSKVLGDKGAGTCTVNLDDPYWTNQTVALPAPASGGVIASASLGATAATFAAPVSVPTQLGSAITVVTNNSISTTTALSVTDTQGNLYFPVLTSLLSSNPYFQSGTGASATGSLAGWDAYNGVSPLAASTIQAVAAPTGSPFPFGCLVTATQTGALAGVLGDISQLAPATPSASYLVTALVSSPVAAGTTIGMDFYNSGVYVSSISAVVNLQPGWNIVSAVITAPGAGINQSFPTFKLTDGVAGRSVVVVGLATQPAGPFVSTWQSLRANPLGTSDSITVTYSASATQSVMITALSTANVKAQSAVDLAVTSASGGSLTETISGTPLQIGELALCIVSVGAEYFPGVNFLTGQNAGFEGGIGTWVADGNSNCTVAPTSTTPHTGSGALAMTSVAAGDMFCSNAGGTSAGVIANGMPCVAGQTARASAWFRASTTPRTTRVAVTFWDPFGQFLGGFYPTGSADSTSAWTQQFNPGAVAPAGTAYARAEAWAMGTGGAGELHEVDDVTLILDGSAPPGWTRLSAQSYPGLFGTLSVFASPITSLAALAPSFVIPASVSYAAQLISLEGIVTAPPSALFDGEHLWQVSHDGVPVFEFFNETEQAQLADQSEQRTMVSTGPGTITSLAWADAMPPGFPNIVHKTDAIQDGFAEINQQGQLQVNTSLWNVLSPASHVQLNPSGTLQLTGSPSTTFAGATPYDLTNSLFSAQVIPLGQGAGTDGSQVSQMYFQSNANSNEYVLMGVTASGLYCKLGDPAGNQVKQLGTYNATTQLFWQISHQFSANGAISTISFWTSADGQTWTLVWQVEPSWVPSNGTVYFSAKYDVDNAQVMSVTGVNGNVVTPSSSGNLYFGQPILSVWYSLLQAAQGRGTIPFVTTALNGSTDSFSNPWTDSESVQIQNGTDLYSLLQTHTAIVNADFIMEPGFRLVVGLPAETPTTGGAVSLGYDRSTTVILHEAGPVSSTNHTRDRSQIANLVGAVNSDGTTIAASNTASQLKWGQREGWVQTAVQVDPVSMLIAAQASVLQTKDEIPSFTVTINPAWPGCRPWHDFRVGDWVGLETTGNHAGDPSLASYNVQPVRVIGIAPAVDANGSVTTEITLVTYRQWLANQLQYLVNKMGGQFINSLGTTPVTSNAAGGPTQLPTIFAPSMGNLTNGTPLGFLHGAPLLYNSITGEWQPAGTFDALTGNPVNPTSVNLQTLHYSGLTPQPNSLIAAVAPTAGTDQQGNSWPAGVSVQGSGSGVFVYSGPAASGNLIVSMAGMSGSDQFGNTWPEGLGVFAGVLQGVAASLSNLTINPGPILLFGNTTLVTQRFTASGTVTAPANATSVTALLYGQGGNGFSQAAGAGGGGGGEFAQDNDSVTALANYTLTMDATSTRITFNSKTITAHAGFSSASNVGAAGGSGSTNAIHFNGGKGANAAISLHQSGGGGGGAGPGGQGGPGTGVVGGLGGAAAGLGPAGGMGGNGRFGAAGNPGTAPGGGGGGGTSGAGAGAAGLAFFLFTVSGGSTGLLASGAQNAGVDPASGAAYQAGWSTYNPVFGTSVSMNGGVLSLGSVPGTANFRSANGNAIYGNTADGNTYDTGVLHVDLPQTTVTAVSGVGATGIGAVISVLAQKYKVHVRGVYTEAAAAVPSFSFAIPAASSAKFTSMINNTSGAASGTASASSIAIGPVVGPTMSGKLQVLDYWAEATFTAAGNFQFEGSTSIGADPFVWDSGQMELYPIN